jgi:hypothetical protein
MMIFEKEKLLFVHVPKTGGTSIIRWLNKGSLDGNHYPYNDDLVNLYLEYKTFAIFRDPISRFVSAYKYLTNYDCCCYGTQMYRGDIQQGQLVKSFGADINQFINDISPRDLIKFVHFRPQCYFICSDDNNKPLVEDLLFFEDYGKIISYVKDNSFITPNGEPPVTRKSPQIQYNLTQNSIDKLRAIYARDYLILESYKKERHD